MATNGNDGAQQTPRTELARTLLALADPIRLRMLNLMFAGALCPQEFAQLLGVDEKTVSRHLVLFRESKLVALHTRNNIKYYTVRESGDCRHFKLLSLVVELLEDDSALRTDIAFFNRSQDAVPQQRSDEAAHHPKYLEATRPRP